MEAAAGDQASKDVYCQWLTGQQPIPPLSSSKARGPQKQFFGAFSNRTDVTKVDRSTVNSIAYGDHDTDHLVGDLPSQNFVSVTQADPIPDTIQDSGQAAPQDADPTPPVLLEDVENEAVKSRQDSKTQDHLEPEPLSIEITQDHIQIEDKVTDPKEDPEPAATED